MWGRARGDDTPASVAGELDASDVVLSVDTARPVDHRQIAVREREARIFGEHLVGRVRQRELRERRARLVEQSDELKKKKAELTAKIEEAEADFSGYSENVAAEIKAAEERRAALESDRESRMGPMPTEVLAEYEKLLDAREGQAIAELDGRICQGCYVSVPNNIYVRLARGTTLVTCPSCNRILYLPEL